MERFTPQVGNTGVRGRINHESTPFGMNPLMSQKKVSILSTLPPVVIKKEESPVKEKVPTFEEEQALITARNDREEKERIVMKHHKLALRGNNMGVFHERIGKTEKALQCYQVALRAVHETKSFHSPDTLPFSACLPSVVPEDVKTPIVINVKREEILLHERAMITVTIMCNLGSLYRRHGKLGRGMEFYNMAYSTVSSCEGFGETANSRQLQKRLIDYIEANVELLRKEGGIDAYEENTGDDDSDSDSTGSEGDDDFDERP